MAQLVKEQLLIPREAVLTTVVFISLSIARTAAPAMSEKVEPITTSVVPAESTAYCSVTFLNVLF